MVGGADGADVGSGAIDGTDRATEDGLMSTLIAEEIRLPSPRPSRRRAGGFDVVDSFAMVTPP
jgi:hypothetical protein